jgi:hypothetical protein
MTRNSELEILIAAVRLKTLISADRGLQSRRVIAVYTAMASNFIAWLAVAGHFVKSEVAKTALLQNLQCEVGDNHRGMLLDFAEKCDALPDYDDYQYVSGDVGLVWALLRDPEYRGLRGLAVVATLEYLSLTFVPELARRAEECGCTDHQYPRVHGEADIAHSDILLKALKAEIGADYRSAETVVIGAVKAAEDLVRRIFS